MNEDIAAVRESYGALTPVLVAEDIEEMLRNIPALLDKMVELRAILAPLLDDPEDADSGACMFCGAHMDYDVVPDEEWRDTTLHEPDCPVRRKDDLLGRPQVPGAPEGVQAR